MTQEPTWKSSLEALRPGSTLSWRGFSITKRCVFFDRSDVFEYQVNFEADALEALKAAPVPPRRKRHAAYDSVDALAPVKIDRYTFQTLDGCLDFLQSNERMDHGQESSYST